MQQENELTLIQTDPVISWLGERLPYICRENFALEFFREFAGEDATSSSASTPEASANTSGSNTSYLQSAGELNKAIGFLSFVDLTRSPYREFVARVLDQVRKLIAMASGLDDEGTVARQAISYVLTGGGKPVIRELQDQTTALISEALIDLAEPGRLPNQARMQLVGAIQSAFSRTLGMSEQSRLNLLAALVKMSSADGDGETAIADEELAETLLTALEFQLESLPVDMSEKLQLELLKQPLLWEHPSLEPILDAIRASEYPFDSVKKEASTLLDALTEPVIRFWGEVPVDQVASLDDRADNMEQARIVSDNVNHIIISVFASCKGCDIESYDDPRVPVLESMLAEENERLRLAAAWTVAQLASPEKTTRLFEDSVFALAEACVGSSSVACMMDAVRALSEISKGTDTVRELVETAKVKASEQFVRRNL